MNKDLTNRGIRSFMVTNMQHRRVVGQHFSTTGLFRSQHHMLMCLNDNPGISQKDVAKLLGISAAATAVSLKKLEKGGYIKKVVNKEDNRCNHIELTEQGKKVVDVSHEISKYLGEEFFRGFTEEEAETWCALMERVYKNLERIDMNVEVQDE